MGSLTQTELTAADYLARRDGGEWTERDSAELSSWLGASPSNRIAFLRLEAAWEETLRLKALAAGLPPGAGAGTDWRLPTESPEARTDDSHTARASTAAAACRVPVRMFAVAAGTLLVVAAAIFAGVLLFGGDRYATPVGGMASVPLQDGSSVLLNTASRIRIELSAEERHVDLTRGEAFFDVARDPARPFVVSAGRKRIVVMGTKFSVRREREDVRVVVTEGEVKVEDLARPAPAVLVSAGGIARTGAEGVVVQRKTPPEAEVLLSWRTGYLTFYDTPLAQAIAEFNQYNRERIVIDDPAVAAIPLTGKFKSTNAEAFIRLLRDGYGIGARRANGRVVLVSGAATQ